MIPQKKTSDAELERLIEELDRSRIQALEYGGQVRGRVDVYGVGNGSMPYLMATQPLWMDQCFFAFDNVFERRRNQLIFWYIFVG